MKKNSPPAPPSAYPDFLIYYLFLFKSRDLETFNYSTDDSSFPNITGAVTVTFALRLSLTSDYYEASVLTSDYYEASVKSMFNSFTLNFSFVK